MKLPSMFTMRKRTKYLTQAFLSVIIAFVLADPDLQVIQNLPFGAVTIDMLLQLAKGILYIVAVHNARKAIFDYPEADFQAIAKKALGTSSGAGMLAISISIIILAFTLAFTLVPRG